MNVTMLSNLIDMQL